MSAGRDFVVMGTDGLFDNLYDEDIENCLRPGIKPAGKQDDEEMFELADPEGVANCMATKAYNLSKDTRYNSPFAKGAWQARIPYRGGKEDDITVIVSQIISK